MPVMLFAWDLAATRPGSAAVRQKEIEEQRGLLYSFKKGEVSTIVQLMAAFPSAWHFSCSTLTPPAL